MTISKDRRRISIAMLGVFVATAICANRVVAQSATVPMTLNANMQLKNLHPAVTHVQLQCDANTADIRSSLSEWSHTKSNKMPVVNSGYAGSMTATISVPRDALADPVSRTVNVKCSMLLIKAGGTAADSVALVVASAAQPQGVTDSNWAVVATGSTVSWTQMVTFPNASPQ